MMYVHIGIKGNMNPYMETMRGLGAMSIQMVNRNGENVWIVCLRVKDTEIWKEAGNLKPFDDFKAFLKWLNNLEVNNIV